MKELTLEDLERMENESTNMQGYYRGKAHKDLPALLAKMREMDAALQKIIDLLEHESWYKGSDSNTPAASWFRRAKCAQGAAQSALLKKGGE